MVVVNGKLLDRHEAAAVVHGCMDFRFMSGILDAIFETFGLRWGDYDPVLLAGGAKNISSPDEEGEQKVVLKSIRIAVEKHYAGRIVLLTHQNCGAYELAGHTFTNPDEERAFHEKELRLAGDIMFRHFPQAQIQLGYVYVDGNDTVRIDPVKP